jgi:septum formation protein
MVFHSCSLTTPQDLSCNPPSQPPNSWLMIILASTSEARRRMLTAAGITYEAVRPTIDEDAIKQNNPSLQPRELALLLARLKAQSLLLHYPQDLVIGCDQVLSCEGRTFNKPRSEAEAGEHLEFLAGKTHTLHTSMFCQTAGKPSFELISEPNLTMRSLSSAEIKHYLQEAGSAILSCVGCYQIEGLGSRLFESIDGDLFSIQGLPLLPLLAHLRTRELIT